MTAPALFEDDSETTVRHLYEKHGMNVKAIVKATGVNAKRVREITGRVEKENEQKRKRAKKQPKDTPIFGD